MDSMCASARITKSASSCHEAFANPRFEKNVCTSQLIRPMCIWTVPCLKRATTIHPFCAHRRLRKVRTTLELVRPVGKSTSITIPARAPRVVAANSCFKELLPKASSLPRHTAFVFLFLCRNFVPWFRNIWSTHHATCNHPCFPITLTQNTDWPMLNTCARAHAY